MPKKDREVLLKGDEHPEWTTDMLRRARPLAEVLEESKRRGRPILENKKVMVSLRLEPELVAAYRATGRGWQGRMRETIAKYAPTSRRTAKATTARRPAARRAR
jgi:uncharacterized protein (DUF4415 family)